MASSNSNPLNDITSSGETGTANHVSIHPPPGYAVFIVNHEEVSSGGPFEFITRKGAKKDLDHMKYIFLDRFRFQWLNEGCHMNLRLSDFDHRYGVKVVQNPSLCCLKCCIQATDHSNNRYFCLVISSHGQEIDGQQHLIFSDGYSLKLSEVYDTLCDDGCPTLRGKSRLVILQTCRSNLKQPENLNDQGVNVHVVSVPNIHETPLGNGLSEDQNDGPKKCRFTVTKVPEPHTTNVTSSMEPGIEDNRLPSPALPPDPLPVVMQHPPDNFLVLFAVTAGKRSKRNTENGSWMLHEMGNILSSVIVDQQHPFINMISVITKTAHCVSFRETEVFMKDEDGNQVLEDGNPVRDESRSGFKNAICVQFCLKDEVYFHMF